MLVPYTILFQGRAFFDSMSFSAVIVKCFMQIVILCIHFLFSAFLGCII